MRVKLRNSVMVADVVGPSVKAEQALCSRTFASDCVHSHCPRHWKL